MLALGGAVGMLRGRVDGLADGGSQWKQMLLDSHWASILSGARQRNLPVEITRRDAWQLFLQQNQRCALTGFLLVLKPHRGEHRTASLDRIDSKRGYVPGNVQWVHRDINRLKSDWSTDQFLAMARAVVEFSSTPGSA